MTENENQDKRQGINRRQEWEIFDAIHERLKLYPHTNSMLTKNLKMHHRVVQKFLDMMMNELDAVYSYQRGEKRYYKLIVS